MVVSIVEAMLTVPSVVSAMTPVLVALGYALLLFAGAVFVKFSAVMVSSYLVLAVEVVASPAFLLVPSLEV